MNKISNTLPKISKLYMKINHTSISSLILPFNCRNHTVSAAVETMVGVNTEKTYHRDGWSIGQELSWHLGVLYVPFSKIIRPKKEIYEQSQLFPLAKLTKIQRKTLFSPPNVSIQKLSLLNSSNKKCVPPTCFFVFVTSNAGSDQRSDQIQKIRAGSQYLNLTITI